MCNSRGKEHWCSIFLVYLCLRAVKVPPFHSYLPFSFHCTLLHRNVLLCSVCAHEVWIKILI